MILYNDILILYFRDTRSISNQQKKNKYRFFASGKV